MAQSYFLEKKTFEIINLGIFSKFVEGKTNVVFQNSVSFQKCYSRQNIWHYLWYIVNLNAIHSPHCMYKFNSIDIFIDLFYLWTVLSFIKNPMFSAQIATNF